VTTDTIICTVYAKNVMRQSKKNENVFKLIF